MPTVLVTNVPITRLLFPFWQLFVLILLCSYLSTVFANCIIQFKRTLVSLLIWATQSFNEIKNSSLQLHFVLDIILTTLNNQRKIIKPENCCLRTKHYHARRSPLLSGLIKSEVKMHFFCKDVKTLMETGRG